MYRPATPLHTCKRTVYARSDDQPEMRKECTSV
jgi:hypothetical protein